MYEPKYPRCFKKVAICGLKGLCEQGQAVLEGKLHMRVCCRRSPLICAAPAVWNHPNSDRSCSNLCADKDRPPAKFVHPETNVTM